MDGSGESAFDRLSREVVQPPDRTDPEVRARYLRLALQMADFGIRMMRSNLRRQHPEDSDAGIEARLAAWLHDRPGAEAGDAWGRPAPERFSSR